MSNQSDTPWRIFVAIAGCVLMLAASKAQPHHVICDFEEETVA